jgi:metal-sulfur cluster biosynthetic enzyme
MNNATETGGRARPPGYSDAQDREIHDRRREVWACLHNVMDPELDESVVDLNFVSRVDIDLANQVHIEFRLPTYWCAANFSFLMADDMRRAVSALGWVERVSVVLGEHMYADKINAGLAKGLSFQETFGEEADGDVDELRRTFLLKAFQRRQFALLQHLIAAGWSPDAIVSLTLTELGRLSVDDTGAKLVLRYLDRRAVVGSRDPDARAFVDITGALLKAADMAGYVVNLRRVGINAEFNGALCRGLLSARFDLDTPFIPKSKKMPAVPDTPSVV